MFSLEVLEVAIYALAALVRALGWLFVLLCSILVFAIGVTRSSQGCFLLGFLTTVDIATRTGARAGRTRTSDRRVVYRTSHSRVGLLGLPEPVDEIGVIRANRQIPRLCPLSRV